MSHCEEYYNVFTGNQAEKGEKTFISVREMENSLLKEANKFSSKKEEQKDVSGLTTDFLAIMPRKAFGLMNKICSEMVECDDSIGFIPKKKGCGAQLDKKLSACKSPEGKFLSEAIAKMKRLNAGISKDCFYHELVCSVLATQHSQPPRIQTFAEPVLTEFLEKKVYRSSKTLKNNVKIFPVEGVCSALINIFNTLKYNGLLIPGDEIGVISPVSSGYFELPTLRNYELRMVCIESDPENPSNIPVEQLNKISDKNMKAMLLMDPSDASGQALSCESIQNLQKLVRKDNPELILITVSSYAPFTENFNSVWDNMSQNSIGVFGFSEYFGAAGWNLACIVTHNSNLIDRKLLKNAPEDVNSRYKIMTSNPERLKLMDRIVMDSRQVVGFDVAGMATPSQVLMCLFAAQELLDKKSSYATNVKLLLSERLYQLGEGLENPVFSDTLSSDCMVLLDLIKLAGDKAGGCEFGEYLKNFSSCLEFCSKLAREYGSVVLPGVALVASEWKVRISLCSMDDRSMYELGCDIRELMDIYYEKFLVWKEKKRREEIKKEKEKAGI